MKGHIEAVRILIKSGADVFVSDADGQLALDRAKKNGYNAIADLFLD